MQCDARNGQASGASANTSGRAEPRNSDAAAIKHCGTSLSRRNSPRTTGSSPEYVSPDDGQPNRERARGCIPFRVPVLVAHRIRQAKV
jgi:hypothetical protein